MCCSTGNTRERLKQIDLEFYTLRSDELPENNNIRSTFTELQSIATSQEPTWSGDGRIEATLATAHHTKLKKLAKLVWELHREFSEFMNSDSAA